MANLSAQHDPARATTFVDELLDHCAALADMPLTYPLVPRYERHGIRRYAYYNHLNFYRITQDIIKVIHIVHGSRNYGAMLFLDEKKAG